MNSCMTDSEHNLQAELMNTQPDSIQGYICLETEKVDIPGLHCKERFTSFRRNFTVYIVGHHWRHENLTLERYSSSSNILLEKTNRLHLGIIINTDFEGKRPNMIGFSCMKAVYKYTHLPPWQKRLLYSTFRCITRKKASNRENTRPLISISYKNSNYCYIPRSSKHTDTCKWSGRVF